MEAHCSRLRRVSVEATKHAKSGYFIVSDRTSYVYESLLALFGRLTALRLLLA